MQKNSLSEPIQNKSENLWPVDTSNLNMVQPSSNGQQGIMLTINLVI